MEASVAAGGQQAGAHRGVRTLDEAPEGIVGHPGGVAPLIREVPKGAAGGVDPLRGLTGPGSWIEWR